MKRILLFTILMLLNIHNSIGSADRDDREDERFCDQYEYCDAIYSAAKTHNVNPELIMAIILQECRGKGSDCPRGSSGEYGHMQIMPFNFLPHERGRETNDYVNINAGTRYFAYCRRLRHTLKGALHCYNAGPRGYNPKYVNGVLKYFNRVKSGNLNP